MPHRDASVSTDLGDCQESLSVVALLCLLKEAVLGSGYFHSHSRIKLAVVNLCGLCAEGPQTQGVTSPGSPRFTGISHEWDRTAPSVYFFSPRTDSICSEDLPPLLNGSDDTWPHQVMYLPSEWKERARVEAVEVLLVPDAMCLHINPCLFLMKTKLCTHALYCWLDPTFCCVIATCGHYWRGATWV